MNEVWVILKIEQWGEQSVLCGYSTSRDLARQWVEANATPTEDENNGWGSNDNFAIDICCWYQVALAKPL